MKIVYFVTHGEKNRGPNPGMTGVGFAQVRALKALFPPKFKPKLVICGTGKRHLDVRQALGFENALTRWTSLVGGPESLESINGHNLVILADGTSILLVHYMSLSTYGTSALLSILDDVPNNTIVCSGRPAVSALGKANAKSAAMYRISFEGAPVSLSDLKIKEVKALGKAEKGTV